MKSLLVLLIALCSTCLLGQSLSKKDSNFVRMSADHTLLEIKLAQLAPTNSSSPEVKTLAADLLAYHTKASGELKTLALQKNITLDNQLTEKSQKQYDKFAKKQGKEFDKAYTKCAAKTHKGGSCYLKKQSKKAKDAEIRSWAATNYPVLEQKSDAAKATCKTIKKQS